MNFVRGALVIIYLLLFVQIPALAVNPMFNQVRADCQRFLNTQCKMPETVRRSLEACHINKKAHNCDALAAKKPKAKDLILSCDAREYCEQQTYSARDEAEQCWQGIKESWKDTFTAVSVPLITAWSKLKKDLSKRRAFLAACEKSISCKRDLIQANGRSLRMSDAELSKFSADYLLRLGESGEYANQYAYDVAASTRPYPLRDPKSTNTTAATQASDKDLSQTISNLWNAASEIASEKYHLYACYTPEAKEAVKCYVFASLIDPTSGVSKPAKVAKAGKGRAIIDVLNKAGAMKNNVNYIPTR